MLLEKRCLEHLLPAVLEHAGDRLTVGNVERDDPGVAVVGAFEPFGGIDELGFAEAGGELEHGFVGDRDTCESHERPHTCSCPRDKGGRQAELDAASGHLCCKRYGGCVVADDDGGEAAS